MKNPKNDTPCHAITTRNGKTTIDLSAPTLIDQANEDDHVDVDVDNSSEQTKVRIRSRSLF